MSNINPNNIDGSYPIAGQDNDSQGFRNNFTNILNNFAFAKSEIEDIQNKAIFKNALSGSTLDNNFNGSQIANVAMKSVGQSLYDFGTTSGTIDINFYSSNFFKVITGGSISLSLTNWPDYYASVRVWITVTNVAHTVQFPVTVNVNATDVSGFGFNGLANTITFENTGNYVFEISSYDGGSSYSLQDLSRNKSAVEGNLSVSSNVYLTSATSSINATNVNIVGNLVATEDLVIRSGVINSGYFIANVVTEQNLVANVAFNRFICNAAPHGTVANLFITLPSTGSALLDGREIEIVSTVPITSCFVSNMTPNTTSVLFLPNNWASTGNVTAKLMYSTTSAQWYRVG
jgi:hypothetical protein